MAGVIPIPEWTYGIWPNINATLPNQATGTTYTMDAVNEKVGRTHYVKRGGNIRRIVFAFATITTGATFNVSIETLNASGMPSGTLWGTNCSGTITVASTDDNFIMESGNLTADCAVNAGDRIALVIAQSGSGNAVINAFDDAGFEYNFTYSSNSTAGWVKQIRVSSIWIKYDDGSYEINEPIILGANIGATTAINTGTNPLVHGNQYTVPFDTTLIGANSFADRDGDSVMNVSAGGHPYLSTCTFTTTHRSATTGIQAQCYFQPPVSISSGTAFYIFYRPTTVTSLTVYEYNALNVSDLSVYDGYKVFKATATSSYSWSVMQNRRAFITPIFKDVSYPASGASGGYGHAY